MVVCSRTSLRSNSRYYQSKRYCPVSVVLQGGGQCISPLGGAFQRDRNRTVPFGLINWDSLRALDISKKGLNVHVWVLPPLNLNRQKSKSLNLFFLNPDMCNYNLFLVCLFNLHICQRANHIHFKNDEFEFIYKSEKKT